MYSCIKARLINLLKYNTLDINIKARWYQAVVYQDVWDGDKWKIESK